MENSEPVAKAKNKFGLVILVLMMAGALYKFILPFTPVWVDAAFVVAALLLAVMVNVTTK